MKIITILANKGRDLDSLAVYVDDSLCHTWIGTATTYCSMRTAIRSIAAAIGFGLTIEENHEPLGSQTPASLAEYRKMSKQKEIEALRVKCSRLLAEAAQINKTIREKEAELG